MKPFALVVVTAILIAGCDYESPLTTEANVPIDPALLGAWEVIEEPGEAPPPGENLLVMLRLSPTEYLVHDKDGNYYRGCLVDVGGQRCFQLQDLGNGVDTSAATAGYLLGTCVPDGDTLTVSLLNEELVPPRTLKATADIRAAVMRHRDAPDLFEPVARLRRRLMPTPELPAPEPDHFADRDRVETVALGPGGRLLVAGLRSGHVAAIDLVTGELAWSAAAHDQPVRCLAFGANDRWVLTAGDDLRATLRRGDNGREWVSFEAVPLRKVYEIALSSDARYAATRGFDGFGRVWDLRLDREVAPLHAYGFAFGPQGRFIASTFGRDPGMEILHLWPRKKPDEPLRVLPEHRVQGVAVDDTGTRAVATGGSDDGSAMVWLLDADDGQLAGQVTIPPSPKTTEPIAALAPAFSADSRALVVGVSDGRIARIDVTALEVVDTWRLPSGSQARRVGFVGEDIWVTSIDDAAAEAAPGAAIPTTTRLLRIGSAEPVWALAGEATMSAGHPVGAAVTADGDLLLFDRASGAPAWRLRPFVKGTRWDVRRAR